MQVIRLRTSDGQVALSLITLGNQGTAIVSQDIELLAVCGNCSLGLDLLFDGFRLTLLSNDAGLAQHRFLVGVFRTEAIKLFNSCLLLFRTGSQVSLTI